MLDHGGDTDHCAQATFGQADCPHQTRWIVKSIRE
jgi:hypothetical protein